MATNPTPKAIVHDIPLLFRVYDDGTVERHQKLVSVPPSDNLETGVRSKDVVVVPENNVWVRIYLPKTAGDEKFPVLVYIHGGAFSIESASSTTYDAYLHALTAKANVVTVSIDYRLAPEHKLPACYDDCWAVMQWVASHVGSGPGSDPWLKAHADLSRVFLAGDSAGANLAHYMMVKSGDENNLENSLKPVGMILAHPYFGAGQRDIIWEYIYPDYSDLDLPKHDPGAVPGLLSGLKCSKIMVCIAEKDFIRDRGLNYYEALKKSEWNGQLELVDIDGEEHVFHLLNPNCEKAGHMMDRVVSFLNSPSKI